MSHEINHITLDDCWRKGMNKLIPILFLFMSFTSACAQDDLANLSICPIKDIVATSTLNWPAYPNWACEVYGEYCDEAKSMGGGSLEPKYIYPKEIASFCRKNMNALFETGVSWQAVREQLINEGFVCDRELRPAPGYRVKDILGCHFGGRLQASKNYLRKLKMDTSREVLIPYHFNVVIKTQPDPNMAIVIFTMPKM